MLPTSSCDTLRSDPVSLADEVSRLASPIKWSRPLNGPTSSCDTLRSDPVSLAVELSRLASTIKWSRLTDKGDIERTAELASVTGYCSLGDLLDTSVVGRDRLDSLLLVQPD